jgi:hypothetical protein
MKLFIKVVFYGDEKYEKMVRHINFFLVEKMTCF